MEPGAPMAPSTPGRTGVALGSPVALSPRKLRDAPRRSQRVRDQREQLNPFNSSEGTQGGEKINGNKLLNALKDTILQQHTIIAEVRDELKAVRTEQQELKNQNTDLKEQILEL